ncbi:MAG: TonB-dependent receptor [Bacteroidaceae bacterium]|nr:TonB-dependent receptor [Bacteroidaceae bacterium]
MGYAQSVTIMGTIVDDEKSPLELALINIEGQLNSTRSDLKGKYSLTCKSTDSLVVVFSTIGYQTRKRILKNPTDTVRIDIMLPKLGIELEQVQINEIRRQTNSMSDVNLKDTHHLGNASGQGVEQIITTQAGVSTHNELSNQYNVRGGSFDENSVYLNGIEVYRPQLIRSGQQEGLSIINPDMVEKVGFSAGGFDAQYGDKMSSVLDITYKKVKQFESSLSASLLGASAYIGIGNDKISWTNAVRYKTMKNILSTSDTQGEYNPKDIDYQSYLSWSPNQRWTIDLIGNISSNNFEFTPSDRETKFGTSEDIKSFKVYFDGKEKDQFQTLFGAITITHNFNSNNSLSILGSAFQTKEKETFDIQGEYWLSDETAAQSLGIGTYKQHARNRLTADVQSFGIIGKNKFTGHSLSYGLIYKNEKIKETIREWELRDSAGYSLPHNADRLDLIYNLSSNNTIRSNRIEAYIQDKFIKQYKEGEIVLNYGARISHWDYNNETLFSPRATIAFIPAGHEDLLFRFSTGVYYQAPFYKELKDTICSNGNFIVRLNEDIKSQKSIHFVFGTEYKFRIDNRPFKFTTELYYKLLSDLVPFKVDNVRVIYAGENCASGYTAGLDCKLYGEFVPGTDSWVSFGLMKTEEKIQGKWSPRPTDQLLNFGIFFSDYFPNTDKWKISVQGHYASGLPFGAPFAEISNKKFRFPAYRRVDIGISYCLIKQGSIQARKTHLKDLWIGLDAFNILDISNVNSYYWVTDIANHQYAVPNYLTGRQLNARILVDL